ncbi:MAG: hypothetical protein UV61_C0016G0014 [Candidatus Gottesmanbacteria bacterium GW2011_GWB1_43_11]|uniref:PWWP domain-containing protein n=1 Tax=Candidatus Gottesmanbacteria bacterium GW2011_GWB1_43_11 TaxID=1618446 RepID=A0A0G1CJJ2_9BACT|nr:MAG: hypothetical protein UV04_C0006G0038 [Candidatus Gottesmanbacteria bacterium GW2011_GWA2_42_16]KKS52982.1 MAG: hypothetical protein UV17_C0042G0006 [Candidatus Gottesmanbacteria bacterium GW2011_GWA1_42_26]KKS80833.1 MAG: hypothetical protein UV55_C0028G0006 [Candidatus Gottesmanbacteria bacterium GW2011_GWC1_43_10]KKS85642.1 MAG: hypothetical protein UV61_C0016G0014 [Candidatus Gottesmanbacteria bacterium GW2011_GWB1_43_11]OGG10642.1 MAG: hypothetical protein A2699_00245 [Candidatus Go
MTDAVPQASSSKYVGFGRRFLAFNIDLLLINLITLLIILPLSFSVGFAVGASGAPKSSLSWLNILSGLIGLSTAVGYYVLFWTKQSGQTLGNRLLALRVIKEDGSELDVGTSVIRYIGYVLSGVILGLGYLWVIFDSKKQGWHDKIAKTYVVESGGKSRTGLAIFIVGGIYLLTITAFIGAMFLGIFAINAIKNNPQIKRELPGLAVADYKKNMAPEAKVHYDRYNALVNQAKTISNNSSLPLAEREKRIRPIADEFIGELKTAAQLDPQNPVIWVELGNAYTWPNTVGTKEDSLNAFKKASDLEPNITVYINFVGDTLFDLGRYDEAIQEFERSISISENSGYAHLSLGKAYAKVGKNDLAKQHLQRAIDIFLAENKDNKYDNQIIDARKVIDSLPK